MTYKELMDSRAAAVFPVAWKKQGCVPCKPILVAGEPQNDKEVGMPLIRNIQNTITPATNGFIVNVVNNNETDQARRSITLIAEDYPAAIKVLTDNLNAIDPGAYPVKVVSRVPVAPQPPAAAVVPVVPGPPTA